MRYFRIYNDIWLEVDFNTARETFIGLVIVTVEDGTCRLFYRGFKAAVICRRMKSITISFDKNGCPDEIYNEYTKNNCEKFKKTLNELGL